MSRKVFIIIEIVLLILNIVALMCNYRNGNYKSACLNSGAIGVVSMYLLFLIGGIYD